MMARRWVYVVGGVWYVLHDKARFILDANARAAMPGVAYVRPTYSIGAPYADSLLLYRDAHGAELIGAARREEK